MKIKTLFAATLFAGFNQIWAAPSVPDTITVDSVYSKENNSVTLPIVDLESGRYNTRLSFDTFTRQADGSYRGSVDISPLSSLNDSNEIVMDQGFDPVIAEKLKAFLKQHIVDVSKGGFGKPGAVIRVDMNGKVWRGVIGKKRVNSDEPLNFSDRHRIGSLTKTFVDNTVMQLVDTGVLDLNATIDKYIPEVSVPNNNKITIRDLIAHRSGLFNYVIDFEFAGIQKDLEVNPLKVYKPSDLLAISNSQVCPPIPAGVGYNSVTPPVQPMPVPFCGFEPGQYYSYSNTGLILAGLIIEKVTGKPVVQAVHDYTVKRLGLMRTEFPTDPGIQSNYMHGHADYNCDGLLSSYNGGMPAGPDGPCKVTSGPNAGNVLPVLPAQEIVSYLDPSASWAAGAIISNHDDLAKWMKAYVDGDLIQNKALQKEVLTDCKQSADKSYGAFYCLGMVKIVWPATADPSNMNNSWFGHLGQINGYDNAVFRNTSKNITVGTTNNNYYINTNPDLGTGTFIFQLLSIVDPQPQPATTTKAAMLPLPPINPQALGGE